MKPTEIIAEHLREVAIAIAHDNEDFVCTRCLNTIEALESAIRVLDRDMGRAVTKELDGILER